jgi:hypothetical protein
MMIASSIVGQTKTTGLYRRQTGIEAAAAKGDARKWKGDLVSRCGAGPSLTQKPFVGLTTAVFPLDQADSAGSPDKE